MRRRRMMGRTGLQALAVSLALGWTMAALGADSAAGGFKPKRRSMADYLSGKWAGPASLDSGRMAGTKMQWSFDVPDGDLRKATGIIVNKLKSITLGAASIERRAVSFTAHYEVGDRGFTMECTGRFDPTFNTLAGTCSGMIGKGKFELTRTLAGLDWARIAGEWVGETTPAAGAEGAKPLPFTVKFTNAKDGATATFMADRGYTVEQARPSAYDADERRLDLTLVVAGKGSAGGKDTHDTVRFQGLFDEAFGEFSGIFTSGSAGKGTFKLARPQKKE